jgi:hypothetical protein
MATPERRRLGLRVVLLGAAGLLLAGAFALFATAPRPEVVEPTGARPMRVDTLQVQAEAVPAAGSSPWVPRSWIA